MDFDETRLYYSQQQLQPAETRNDSGEDQHREGDDDDENNVDSNAVRRHFREFLRKLSTARKPWVLAPEFFGDEVLARTSEAFQRSEGF